MLLEFSQYLELYLWPNFNPGRLSPAYIMSIVMIINEKFRQKVPVWKVFRDHPSQVSPGNLSFLTTRFLSFRVNVAQISFMAHDTACLF